MKICKPKLLMIGTDMASKGGISSVIRMYEEGGLLKKMKFLASYTDGSAAQKIRHYLGFLIKYVILLISQPSIRLIHIHTASAGSFYRKSLVIILAKLFGKKTIVHMHGAGFNVFYEKSPILLKPFIRSILASCDVLLALSSQWKEDLHRISGHRDIRVIYNPTILRHPVFQEEIPESPAKQVDGPVRFLFMGRLGKRKGVYDIIESARAIQSHNVEIELYGDGEVEQVKRSVLENKVDDKVLVRGWIDGKQKDHVFRNADVLLLPSYHEGLPISVLEAMAYGMPVVATDVGGIAEAVHDEQNGYLIQPGDCDKLARCIDQLAASPKLRLEMGRSGYKMAEGKFSLPVIIKQVEALYEELVKR